MLSFRSNHPKTCYDLTNSDSTRTCQFIGSNLKRFLQIRLFHSVLFFQTGTCTLWMQESPPTIVFFLCIQLEKRLNLDLSRPPFHGFMHDTDKVFKILDKTCKLFQII